MKKIILVILAACLMLCGCADSKEYSETFYAMDTFMTITAYGKSAEEGIDDARSQIRTLDAEWSVTDTSSELYKLNHGDASAAGKNNRTRELLSYTLDISKKTGGALDPTVYPVLAAWGFTTDENRVPSDEEIARLLENVGYERVTVTDSEVILPEGMMLDLGAVAKGRASDIAAEILRQNGVKSALINLGGNIYALGSKSDGKAWRIGVQDPEGDGNVGVLSLTDSAAVTSGKYHRFFTAPDGTVYGHIIDPSTGYPVDNELLSATIIAADGTLCDALSTAVFVMGKERAEQFWRGNYDMGFEMLLITEDEIIITQGLEERFELSDGRFALTVIK